MRNGDKNDRETAALELWLAKPVPRYTSYPPAPAFHDGINANSYAAALSSLGADERVSLYVHVPFCHKLCLYCGCHTSVTKRPELVERYLDVLIKEMETLTAVLGRRPRVSHLHFGGGTPNIMSAKDMAGLFAAMHRLFDFSDCREAAMELDPRVVTREQTAVLAECGVTRVSLGVQDFNHEVQVAVQREQPYAMVAEVCDWLRGAGINAINFDLMYGLPLQTRQTVADTATKTLNLSPSRVAIFSYAHVPQFKRHQQALEQYGLPDRYALLEMESAARSVLAGNGYAEIGMDHFAKPDDGMAIALQEGRLRRNFQGYTDDTADVLLGTGASSIGCASGAFFQNERDVRTYESIVDSGRLATARGLVLSKEDKLRAAVIEQMMCYMGCDLDAICRAHGFPADTFAPELEALRQFSDAGVISVEGSRITLSSPHRMAIRVISHAFDRYSTGKPATSSRAA